MAVPKVPSYESRCLRIINDQAQDLPGCPVCGGLTNLDKIIIERTKQAGGGQWISYILRCLNSVDPHGLRRLKAPDAVLCSFAVPMTLQPPPAGEEHQHGR